MSLRLYHDCSLTEECLPECWHIRGPKYRDIGDCRYAVFKLHAGVNRTHKAKSRPHDKLIIVQPQEKSSRNLEHWYAIFKDTIILVDFGHILSRSGEQKAAKKSKKATPSRPTAPASVAQRRTTAVRTTVLPDSNPLVSEGSSIDQDYSSKDQLHGQENTTGITDPDELPGSGDEGDSSNTYHSVSPENIGADTDTDDISAIVDQLPEFEFPSPLSPTWQVLYNSVGILCLAGLFSIGAFYFSLEGTSFRRNSQPRLMPRSSSVSENRTGGISPLCFALFGVLGLLLCSFASYWARIPRILCNAVVILFHLSASFAAVAWSELARGYLLTVLATGFAIKGSLQWCRRCTLGEGDDLPMWIFCVFHTFVAGFYGVLIRDHKYYYFYETLEQLIVLLRDLDRGSPR